MLLARYCTLCPTEKLPPARFVAAVAPTAVAPTVVAATIGAAVTAVAPTTVGDTTAGEASGAAADRAVAALGAASAGANEGTEAPTARGVATDGAATAPYASIAPPAPIAVVDRWLINSTAAERGAAEDGTVRREAAEEMASVTPPMAAGLMASRTGCAGTAVAMLAVTAAGEVTEV